MLTRHQWAFIRFINGRLTWKFKSPTYIFIQCNAMCEKPGPKKNLCSSVIEQLERAQKRSTLMMIFFSTQSRLLFCMHLTKFQLGSGDRKINLSLHLCPIDHANKVVIEGPPPAALSYCLRFYKNRI